MPLDLHALKDTPRLLIEAELWPVQGTRFQPTGFPNLGHAVYDAPKEGYKSGPKEGNKTNGLDRMILVESAQSMANRLEAVCWDRAADDWIAPLKGLPVVKVKDEQGAPLTNSVLEAHRLNSEYIARTAEFKATVESEIQFRKDRPFDVIKQLVPILLKYDPNSLLHGIFLEEIAGVIRLPRILSAFIEAHGATVAASGGVKFNRVEPEIKGGEGNVPYARDEWTAEKIIAYFNLDLRQIRAFRFAKAAENLLIVLALFKVTKFLTDGLRLRTACDLDVISARVARPNGFGLPDVEELSELMPGIIDQVAAAGLFSDQRTLTVTYRK